MKNIALFTFLLALAIAVSAQETLTSSETNEFQLQAGQQDDPVGPPMLGPAWPPGSPEYEQQLQLQAGLPNQYMYWHAGQVMPQTKVTAIFWGTRWNNNNYVGDKIQGLDDWYAGFGNSNYAATSNEYRGNNGQVTSNVNYNGHIVDPTKASPGYSPAKILAEVCNQIGNNPDPSGLGYCPGNRTILQFAFFWSLDGPGGAGKGDACTILHKDQELGHSLQLAALSDYSGHEISEARTDPNTVNGRRGWFDLGGNENGDKCLGVFGGPVTFSNNTQWIIQSEWSNLAYYRQSGIGRWKGCLQGQ